MVWVIACGRAIWFGVISGGGGGGLPSRWWGMSWLWRGGSQGGWIYSSLSQGGSWSRRWESSTSVGVNGKVDKDTFFQVSPGISRYRAYGIQVSSVSLIQVQGVSKKRSLRDWHPRCSIRPQEGPLGWRSVQNTEKYSLLVIWVLKFCDRWQTLTLPWSGELFWTWEAGPTSALHTIGVTSKTNGQHSLVMF